MIIKMERRESCFRGIDILSNLVVDVFAKRIGAEAPIFTVLDVGGRRSAPTSTIELLQDESSRRVVLTWDSFDIERVISVDFEVFARLSDFVAASISKSRLQAITPGAFYSDICDTGIFRIFPKQDQAFSFFDELIMNGKARSRRLKIFSFEGISSGVRKFAVAEFGSFFAQYQNFTEGPTSSGRKHVYEIIRENFPCRPYFDLEYSREDNPDTDIDGDRLTCMWVNLVVWKMFELFGIMVSEKDVAVLDCSTPKKYSKHVTLLIPRQQHQQQHFLQPSNRAPNNDTATARGSSTSYSISRGGGGGGGKEWLFRNNIMVGAFVQAIIDDITEPFIPMEEERVRAVLRDTISSSSSGQQNTPVGTGTGTAVTDTRRQLPRRPRPEYECLWVKKDDKRTCFVDLGVYTRNRAFRLFGSTKFGKDTAFGWKGIDRRLYQGMSHTSKSNILSTQLQGNVLKKLKKHLLEASAVVPFDLIDTYWSVLHHDDDNRDDEKDEKSMSSVPPTTTTTIGELFDVANEDFLFVTVPDKGQCFMRDFCTSTGSSSSASGSSSSHFTGTQVVFGGANRGHPGMNDPWKSVEITKSITARQASPFPSIDAFVLRVAGRGGVQGYINSWSLYTASSTHRLRYVIAKNRWCEKIGRPHKSNGIILEVDLTFMVLTQTCFDPDCRGFRSEPIAVPPEFLPPGGAHEVSEKIEDLMIQRAVDENPQVWG